MPRPGPAASPDPHFAPPTPFARLVTAHAASAAGDGAIIASLAGSLFFSQPTGQAREKVLLYLLLTLAPFGIIAPVLGPMLDRVRGGRRLLLIASMALRAVLAFLMSRYITKDAPEGLLIYPLAFGILVLQKTYGIAKSSLVPALVPRTDELVRANSRLNIVSLVAGAVGLAPAYGLHAIFGSDWSLVFAGVIFIVAFAFSLKIPRVETTQSESDQRLEDEELHQPSIQLGGSATAVLRGTVGFLAFFTAFALKDDKLALGFAAAMYPIGNFTGNVVAPQLRQQFKEESILASSMVIAALLAVLGSLAGGTLGFAFALLGMGLGASAGKLGFDSILQRDGPDAARGRAFARYETRFQLTWVLGALIGLVPVSAAAGLLGLMLVLIFTATSYALALETARRRGVYRTKLIPDKVDRALKDARAGAAARMRSRKRRPRSAPQDAELDARELEDGGLDDGGLDRSGTGELASAPELPEMPEEPEEGRAS